MVASPNTKKTWLAWEGSLAGCTLDLLGGRVVELTELESGGATLCADAVGMGSIFAGGMESLKERRKCMRNKVC